jgi:hypothetical protein
MAQDPAFQVTFRIGLSNAALQIRVLNECPCFLFIFGVFVFRRH